MDIMCVIMNYTDKIYNVFKYYGCLLTLLYTFHSDFFHNFFVFLVEIMIHFSRCNYATDSVINLPEAAVACECHN
jgi:hypothetical protein